MTTKNPADLFYVSYPEAGAVGTSTFDRALAIQQARNRKAGELATSFQNVQMKLEGQDQALVNRLGIKRDSFLGDTVQAAASVVSGVGRLAGDTLSLVPDAMAAYTDLGLDQRQLDAYNRIMQGKAQEQDQYILNAPDASGVTPLDRINRANALRNAGNKIDKAFDLSHLVDNTDKNKLTAELTTGFDPAWQDMKDGAARIFSKPISEPGTANLEGNPDLWGGIKQLASGVSGAVGTVLDAAKHNPGAVFQYTAENAPQLLVGTAGKVGKAALAASNLGYGIENYRQGVEDYRKEHGGAMPSAEELQKMVGAGVAAGAAEHVGDTLALGLGRKVADTKGFRKTLMEAGKTVGKSFVEEAGTEGLQTYLEGQAKLKEASAADIFVSGAIGGLSGAMLSGGTMALAKSAESAGKLGEKYADAATQVASKKETAAQFAAAVDSQDTSFFTDKTSPNYDPNKAISALHESIKKEGATPEAVAKAEESIRTIIQDFQDHLEEVSAATPSVKKGFQLEKKELEDQLAEPDKLTPKVKAAAEARLQRLEELLSIPIAKDEDITAVVKQRDALEKQNDAIYDQYFAFKDTLKNLKAATVVPAQETPAETPAPASLALPASAAAAAAAETNPGSATDAVVVQERVKQIMASPDSHNFQDMLDLFNDDTNGLSEKQRSALRVLTESAIKRNALMDDEKVHAEVLFGDKATNQAGIETFRARFDKAMSRDDENYALKQVIAMANFASDRGEKFSKMKEAWQEAKKTGKEFQFLRTEDGTWFYEPKTLPDSEIKKNGGLTVHKNSGGLVNRLQKEAEATAAVSAELEARLYNLTGEETNSGTTPVQGPTASVSAPAEPTKTGPGTGVVPSGEQGMPKVVATFDTDQNYNTWSNRRDGSDRDNFRAQIQSTIKSILPRLKGASEEAVLDFLKGNKWFALADEATQEAGLKAIMGLVPSTPVPVPVPVPVAQKAPEKDVPPWEGPDELQAARSTPEAPVSAPAQVSDGVLTADFHKTYPTGSKPAEGVITFGGKLSVFATDITKKLKETKGTALRITGGDLKHWLKQGNSQESLNSSLHQMLARVAKQHPDLKTIITDAKEGTGLAVAAAAKALGLDLKIEGTASAKEIGALQKRSNQEGSKLRTAAGQTEHPITKKTPEIQAVLDKIETVHGARDFRNPTDRESRHIGYALNRLKAHFGDFTDSIKHITIQAAGKTARSTSFGEHQIIGLSHKTFSDALTAIDESVSDRVLRVLSHEVAHQRDMQVTPEGVVHFSNNTASLNPGGSAYENVKKLLETEEKGSLLSIWFGDLLFNRDLKDFQVPRELLAQLVSLYIVHPEVMRESLPQEFKQVRNFLKTRQEAGQAESVHDGRGSQPETNQGIPDSGSTDAGVSEPEVTAPKVTLETVKENPTAGTLSVMETPLQDEEGQKLPYQKANLLARNFLQESQGKHEGTFRPLVAVKDFLSLLDTEKVDLTPFLPKKHIASFEGNFEPDSGAAAIANRKNAILTLFIDKAKAWREPILRNLVKHRYKDPSKATTKAEDFYFRDMMQFLNEYFVGEDGKPGITLEENITTAMSFALFSYIGENGNAPQINDEKAINRMLGRDEEAEVSEKELKALSHAGKHADLINISLGQRFVQALGLKLKKDAPVGDMARLQGAVGAHIAKLGSTSINGEQPLFKRSDVPVSSFKEGDLTDSEKNKKLPMYRINTWQKEGERTESPVPAVAQIADAYSGTEGVLAALFSVDAGAIEPTFEPQEVDQEYAKNSRFQVPQFLLKALDKMAGQGSKLRQDYWNLFTAVDSEGKTTFTQEQIEDMNGFETVDEYTFTDNAAAIRAKNDGISRGIANFFNFVNNSLANQPDGYDTPMFFQFSVWLQQRVGIKTNLINPQTDKFHRGMLTRDDWTTQVSTDDKASMDNMKLRIMEGLGVRTEDQMNAVSLAAFNDLFNPPETAKPATKERAQKLQAGVKALQVTLGAEGTPLTPQQVEDVVTAVRAGGKKMHSLDALMAMAQWRHAQEKAGKGNPAKFTVQLVGEVDGVTNGPILSHILFGAGATAQMLLSLLEKGGFYTEVSGFKSYNQWKSQAGHNDLYEATLGSAWRLTKQVMGSMKPKFVPYYLERMAAIQEITGKLMDDSGKVSSAGRKLIKTPVTGFAFGMSPHRAAVSMGENIIDTLMSQIEEAGRNQESIEKFLKILNTLSTDDNVKFNPKMSFQAFRNRAGGNGLTSYEREVIVKGVTFSFGTNVKLSLEKNFRVFSANRDAMNNIAKLAHAIYSAIYSELKEDQIAELVEMGVIPTNNAGVPIHDLSTQGYNKLQKKAKPYRMEVQTALSKEQSTYGAGLGVTKTSNRMSKEYTYSGVTHFGTATTGNTKSTEVTGNESVLEAPGKAMPPLLAHSTDSYISHVAAILGNVLNIHDAHVSGLGSFEQTAQNLNMATWKAVSSYSPMMEMAEAFAQLLNNVNVGVLNDGKNGLSDRTLHAVGKILFPTAEFEKTHAAREELLDEIDSIAKQFLDSAISAEKIRLDTLSQIKYVNQYAHEDGYYEVTAEDQAAIQKQKDEFEDKITDLRARYEYHLEQLTDITPLKEKPAKELRKLQSMLREDGTEEQDTLDTPNTLALMEGFDALAQQKETPEQAAFLDAVVDQLLSGEVTSIRDLLDSSQKPAELAKQLETLESSELLETPSWLEEGKSFFQVPAWFKAIVSSHGETFPVRSLLHVLQRHLVDTADTPIKKAYLRMLNPIFDVLPETVKVTYLTKDNIKEHLKDAPITKAPGWFTANTHDVSKGVIYVLGSDFKNSSITPEVLLHEMIHAATLTALQRTDPASKMAVAELNKLMEAARAFASKSQEGKKGKLKKAFEAPLSSLEEFIAYGMTNLKFQTEILSKIEVEVPSNWREVVKSKVKGMRGFVQHIYQLLFKGEKKENKDQIVDGMASLIGNVSILMSEKATAIQSENARKITLAIQGESPAQKASQLTHKELLSGLLAESAGKFGLTPEFQEHLTSMLNSVVSSVLDPLSPDTKKFTKTPLMSALDAWEETIIRGEAPFASDIAGSPFVSSPAETFVAEQLESVFHEVFTNPELQVTPAYRELKRLYMEAASVLKPKDFDAAVKYNFLFNIRPDMGGQSRYMSRFLAMALANQEFNQKLNFGVRNKTNKQEDLSFFGRLKTAVSNLMDWLTDLLNHAAVTDMVNERMRSLADQLLKNEAKKRSAAATSSFLDKFIDAETITEKLHDKAKDVVLGIAKNPKFAESTSGYVRGLSGATRIVLQEHGEMILSQLQQMRDRYMKDKHQWVTGLLNEVRGTPETVQKLLRAAKKTEQRRKRDMDNLSHNARESFAPESKAQTSMQHQRALTKVFLNTGMHILLGNTSMSAMHQLVQDPKALQAAIARETASLASNPALQAHLITQAKGLGYYLATGRVTIPVLLMNAEAIIHWANARQPGVVAEEDKAAFTSAVDKLATYYALQYTDNSNKAMVKGIMEEEMQRDTLNGVEHMLNLHRILERESRDRLFAGDELQMTKGFTPSIYNPHNAIEVAYSEEDEVNLMEQGYHRVHDKPLELDPADPDKRMGRLFILKDGGLLPRVTGAMSFRGLHSKGSLRNDPDFSANLLKSSNLNRQSTISANRKAALTGLTSAPDGWTPTEESPTYLAPVLTPKGDIASWRYLMNNRTKETLLEQDSRFDQVLGALGGSIVDKDSVADQNMAVLQALKGIYEKEYTTKQHSFVEISGTSPEREIRELFALLPEKTKKQIETVWGKEGKIMIQRELIFPVFGYRKWSLSTVFEKKQANLLDERAGQAVPEEFELNAVEKLFTGLVEEVLGAVARGKGLSPDEVEQYKKRGAVYMRRTEGIWQGLVHMMKDAIVIKGLAVMINNIKDNIGMLVLQGVTSPKELLKNHWIAIRGALDYKRERAQLAQLYLALQAGDYRGDVGDLKREITLLEDSLSRNPVRELIDAGLMPTISEDLNPAEDLYSYKAQFDRKIENIQKKIPKPLLIAGKWALMTHDTPIYKTLSEITQLSDFVARYVLYKHETTKKNPMSKEDAIKKADETFVNYDVPMHPGLQYLDDHGFTVFIKYFMRIQRVLGRLVRENPLKVLIATLVDRFLGSLPIPTHSSIVYRVGNNPMSAGALGLPSAMGEIATAKAFSLLF